MPLKILLVIESLAQRGGTETQLLELVSRVDSSRFHLHLCCFEENIPPLKLPAPHTVQILPLERINSAAVIPRILRLRAYIRRNRIDIVQTFMFKGSVVGALAAWGTGCRAVVTCRRSLDFSCGHERMTRFLNALTTRILANSNTVKSRVVEQEQVAAEKVDVLWNGVDVERFASAERGSHSWTRLGIPAGAPVVGIVANLRPVKDIPLFLEAAGKVAAAVPEAVFLIIGKGNLKGELETLAHELGIRKKVFFVDGDNHICDYLPHVQVGCLTSKAEGFPNAILEYMAAAIPVVATAVGGTPEAIVHGVTGYLVKQRSPDEFARHIVALLQDDELRTAMGRQGNARCREIFDIAKSVSRQERYWMDLAGESPR